MCLCRRRRRRRNTRCRTRCRSRRGTGGSIGGCKGQCTRSHTALEIRVGKTILKIDELGLFFVLVFLAFLYFFLAREMCFVPISFFTILHFPWPQVARGGKCKIVKNEIGTKHISRARKKSKNAKNTKTKNNPRGKHKTFSRHVTEFCKGKIQRGV